MKTSSKIDRLYEDYYDEDISSKREVAARQTVDHIASMVRQRPIERLLDIGAGEGAVVAELHRRKFAELYHAVEISESGLRAITRRQLPRLAWGRKFDGYRIEADNLAFDLGIAAHVVEHVEHERAFLAEAARVCRLLYVEVPLEHTVSLERAIDVGKQFGHINFYTPKTFLNLLDTAGLEVLEFSLFSNSLEYERFVGGHRTGLVKYALRTGLLRIAPSLAPRLMTYLAGALVRCSPSAVTH